MAPLSTTELRVTQPCVTDDDDGGIKARAANALEDAKGKGEIRNVMERNVRKQMRIGGRKRS